MSNSVPTFKLPHEAFTPFDASKTPTPQEIRTIIAESYANAISVPSPLGGGENGHLGMLMPAADYLLVPLPAGAAVVAFDFPTAPGPMNVVGGTNAAVMNNRDVHTQRQHRFDIATALDRRMASMIMVTVP